MRVTFGCRREWDRKRTLEIKTGREKKSSDKERLEEREIERVRKEREEERKGLSEWERGGGE
jgi:hypothetical protein